ncbi:putative F-box protein isoform X1 [Iris pallida]|uniref:F-box protein isoform X1 n=1 Tax=Iris pallida TaxID=29817 RepID=A0AAX6I4W4_IRIPA|nr:putative F-box protein isoform X1 [Iris pallida]
MACYHPTLSLSPNNIHYNNSTNNNSSSMLKPDPLPCRPPPSPPWSAQPRPGHWPPTSSLSSISSPLLFNHAPPQLLFISSSAHTATTRPNTTISVRHHLAAGRTIARHPRGLTPSPSAPSRERAVRSSSRQQRVPSCACMPATAGATAAVVGGDTPPRAGRTHGYPPMAANVLRDAPSKRFVRFERDPVGAREFGTQNLRSVAATSRTFSQKSDRWIGDFFAPSQSRFAGPTSSACISSTAAPFGVLPVPVRS